jgi:hypothetical protein
MLEWLIEHGLDPLRPLNNKNYAPYSLSPLFEFIAETAFTKSSDENAESKTLNKLLVGENETTEDIAKSIFSTICRSVNPLITLVPKKSLVPAAGEESSSSTSSLPEAVETEPWLVALYRISPKAVDMSLEVFGDGKDRVGEENYAVYKFSAGQELWYEQLTDEANRQPLLQLLRKKKNDKLLMSRQNAKPITSQKNLKCEHSWTHFGKESDCKKFPRKF